MSRAIERVLEEAHLSGDLKLNGRKLKEFPSSEKYDLTDTVVADLSRNRFTEIPIEITNFWCLESLNLHHNTIRSVPDSVTYLQSLIYLDISHNQLSTLPSSICHLPLEILLVSNNKLQSLPSELGYCKTLTELDVSCNQINRLPPQLGLLNQLRCLNIRSNQLLEIPIELTYLKLTRLDISRNRIASLPVELKNMSNSLEILRLTDNPLMAPPAVICARGMVHVFKWLELRNSKNDKKQNSFPADGKNERKKFGELPKTLQMENSGIDWAFLNIDPSVHMYSPADEKLLLAKNLDRHKHDKENALKNGLGSVTSKPTDIQSVPIQKNLNCDSQQNEKGHLQTYREYKESLRQQRTVDSVYKCPQKEVPNLIKPTVVVELAPQSKITSSRTLPKPISVKANGHVEKTNTVVRVKSKVSEVPFDKMQFTMRREYEKAKEEAELIRQLRSTIESRLKVALPENLSTALSDGVVLCHFANHILPHSVASIHVPSPTVPKLTTARARRNVDNFLEACRKIGVEEGLLCDGNDVIGMKENILLRVAVITQNLLRKSKKDFFNSLEHLNNNVQPKNHVCASLTCSSSIFEKLSTAFCLLIFFSINLLLYLYPIPY